MIGLYQLMVVINNLIHFFIHALYTEKILFTAVVFNLIRLRV
jgi:hypothetical protein